jgi:hypothetical protein
VRRVELVDMDGDDDVDLLVVLGGLDSQGVIAVLWNNGLCADAPLCEEQSTAFTAGAPGDDLSAAILDATPIQLDGDIELELLVAKVDGLWVMQLDPDSAEYLEQVQIDDTGGDIEFGGSVRAADVDGDGLTDIVTNTQERLRVFLQQPREHYGRQLIDEHMAQQDGADGGAQ